MQRLRVCLRGSFGIEHGVTFLYYKIIVFRCKIVIFPSKINVIDQIIACLV